MFEIQTKQDCFAVRDCMRADLSDLGWADGSNRRGLVTDVMVVKREAWSKRMQRLREVEEVSGWKTN